MPAIGGAGLNYKGTYSSSLSYNVNDVVQLGGSSYIALVANTNVSPTTGASNATWGLASLAGTAGFGAGLTPIVKSAAYTAASGDLVMGNATGAAFTVTLPASPTTTTVVGVTKTDATSNIVTVTSSAGIDISGATTYLLTGLGQYAEFVWDGSLWHTVRDVQTARVPAVLPVYNNHWYSNLGNVTTSTAMNITAVTFYIPYFLPRAITVGSMGLYVGTGIGGASVRVGAFNMDPISGLPTTILSDFGTLSVTSSGPVSTTGTTAVWPAGWFFLAAAGTSTGGNLYASTNPPYTVTPTGLGIAAYQAFSSSGTGTFAANPSASFFTGNAPLIYFKATV